jgi:hypothetical protein
MSASRIIAGDTLNQLVSVAGYSAADGWLLKYRLAPRFSAPTQAPIALTATAAGSDFRVQETATNTSEYAPGLYAWGAYVEKAAERYTVTPSWPIGAELEVLPNPAAIVQGYDNRSLAQKALDDALAARATFLASRGTVKSYSIAGRSMEFESVADFVTLISELKAEVLRERASRAKSEGRPDPRRITVRLSNG